MSTRRLLPVLLTCLVFAGCGAGDDGPAAEAPATTPAADQAVPTQSRTVVQLAEANAELRTFATAVGASGLDTTLSQPGPYTVFAPNNDAFTKLGSRLDTLLRPAARDDLAQLLQFHVVPGRLTAADLNDGDLLTTLQGDRLRVRKRGATISVGNSVSRATVVVPNGAAANGVVHTIDTVLQSRS